MSMGVRQEIRNNFIKSAIKHQGGLHKSLGIPEDKKIPAKKLEKATHSKSKLIRQQANLAETLKGLRKKK